VPSARTRLYLFAPIEEDPTPSVWRGVGKGARQGLKVDLARNERESRINRDCRPALDPLGGVGERERARRTAPVIGQVPDGLVRSPARIGHMNRHSFAMALASRGRRLALDGTLKGCILQLAAEFVVTGDVVQVAVQAEYAKNPKEHVEAYGEFPSFQPAEREAVDICSRSQVRLRHSTPQAG